MPIHIAHAATEAHPDNTSCLGTKGKTEVPNARSQACGRSLSTKYFHYSPVAAPDSLRCVREHTLSAPRLVPGLKH